MKGKKAEFIVDFSRVKEDKQKRIHNNFTELYAWMFTYLQSEANLREKVRAKHLFRHKLGLPKDAVLTDDLQVHFEHWLLFDYVTVIGSRVFDMFVRAKKNELSKQQLEICGIMMLMHLEPIQIIEKKKNKIMYTPLFETKNKQIEATPYLFPGKFHEGDLVLSRVLKMGIENKLIGPSIQVSPSYYKDVVKRLEKNYAEGPSVYRRYLKEYGIDMLQYKH
ncbi:hypothetical protein [Salipaludibacillus sp. CF4.18]|uniref:hypothetical protein n=1 Tax=Salipaludibacillus sp. CF4.18 TaxID=3373081 RepID=UPI003EE4DC74